MKKLFMLFIVMLFAYSSYAQVPEMFNYQAVVRNDQGEVLANQNVQFQLSILAGSTDGPAVYSESHMKTTNALGIVDLVIGMGTGPDGSLGAIDWGSDTHFLKVELDPTGGTSFNDMGTTQLISVPYAMVSGAVNQPLNKFTVVAAEGHAVDEALFEVQDEFGNTLFAVYPEGTRVYVDDSGGKGLKGGFAVGGYKTTNKGETHEYLRVTPDSVRIYIREPEQKGVKGGFAVGGYKTVNKGEVTPHFFVSVDSTEVYVNDPVNGGFNVKLNQGGGKGNENEIMSVTTANSFIGYEAGYANTIGLDNTFIGTRAGYDNEDGTNNIYLGYEAGFQNTNGSNNIYIGYKAGRNEVGSDRLFIDNDASDTTDALIYGEFVNEMVRINNSLGIGRNATDYSLEVEGDAYKTDPTTWDVASDKRIKTDIRNIENAMEQIMKLRPVSFKYTDYWRSIHPGVQDKTYFNFIAQEFKEVFPGSVSESMETYKDEEENIYKMSNDAAMIVAVKAVQELIEENELQQVLIDQLQKENTEMNDLKERVEKLEGLLSVER
ncbi:tail fiber domain-containing protein [Bacteroidota bacterium]